MHSWLILATLLVTMVAAQQTKLPFPDTHPTIRTVTGQTFREHVVDPTLPVIVFFYNPRQKQSKKVAKEYEKASKALEGYVMTTAFDGSTDEGKGLMEMFGAKTVPSMLYFNPELMSVSGGQEGQYMKMPLGFNAASPDARAIVHWSLQAMASDQIDILEDDQDYEAWTTRYPWGSELSKVILVSSANATSPGFKAVSHEFRYAALFATIRVKENELSSQGFAQTQKGQLLFETLGLKADATLPVVVTVTPSDVDILGLGNGETFLKHNAVRDFVAKVSIPKSRRMELAGMWAEEDKKRKKKEAEDAKILRALPPVVATTESEWNQYCIKRPKKGMCVAIFVEDTEAVDMNMLESAAKKMTQRTSAGGQPPQVVVIHAWPNHEIAEFFGAANAGYPAVVYITGSKGTYVNHIGSFQERSIVSFYADRMRSVRAKTYKKGTEPAFKETKTEEEESAAPSEEGISDE